jgi:hypothetical protein
MSLTILDQPQDHVPAYNPQFFVASSSNYNAANFKYTVKITDLISSETKTYQIPARPDTYCVFDAGPFVESFMTNYIPINLTGWQKATGIRKIRVNVGETYGSTPAYVSGTDIDYVVWNAALSHLTMWDYNEGDYVHFGVTPKYLSSLIDGKTYAGRSNYLYVLGDAIAAGFTSIIIEPFDSAGVTMGQTIIPNAYSGTTNYRDKYVCIDIGHKGMAAYLSGASYYLIYDYVDLGGLFGSTLIKRIDILCEGVYDVYTIHFLARSGAYETCHFSKRSDSEVTKDVTMYKKLPYTLSGGVYSYDYDSAVDRTLSVRTRETLKLNTDWLTEEEAELYSQLQDSPSVYLDLGSSQGYAALTVVNKSYKRFKKRNEKLFQLNMDFEYAHENYRQRG